AGVRQLSEDHSYVAEAIRRGQSEDEARSSPWRDALTRSVGTDADVKVDVFGPFRLEGDMAVVLCSDGLYKALADADIGQIFGTSTDARDAAARLVAAAYDAGSDDNITVVVAEHGQVPRGAEAVRGGGASATLTLDAPFAPAEPERRADAEVAPAAPTGGAAWKIGMMAAVAVVAEALAFGLLRR